MTTVGVLLAAGAGTRYGMPKVLATQGEWLRRAVATLADGGCDRVLVALGAAIVAVPAPARALVVEQWADGQGATLAATLRAAQAPDVDGVLVHLVDLPDVDHRAASAVLVAANSRRNALVRASFEARPGHPVYLGVEHVQALLPTLSGDVGAARYLATHDVELVECGQFSTGDDCDVRQ